MRISNRADHGVNDTRSTDILNDADNVDRLREAIDESVVANEYTPSSGALLVICIANLRIIRDLFGDNAASRVSIEVENRLKKVLRGSDVIGRLGESRFGIVLSRCDPDKIRAAARRFLAAATSARVIIGDSHIEVMLSTASVAFPEEGLTSCEEVIAQAETRLVHEARSGASTLTRFNDGHVLG